MNIRMICAVLAVAMVTGSGAAADWAQWRGPGRNGVVPDGPTLVDNLSAGAAIVWSNDVVPSGREGGLSSPVVADGRVYLFTSVKRYEPIATRTLDADGLEKLGWVDRELPADLLATVTAARLSDERAAVKQADAAAWADQWIQAHLSEPQAGEHGKAAREHLLRGRPSVPLEQIAQLLAIRDRTFGSQAELEQWLQAQGFDAKASKAVLDVVPVKRALADDRVYAFDAADGRQLWDVEYPGTAHDWCSSSTPCVAGGRLYVMGSDGMAYCLDAATGTELWTRRCGEGEVSSSFVQVGELVIVLTAEHLIALHAATGEVAWTQPALRGRHNSPALWVKDGRTWLICNTEGTGMACVDPHDGRILWTVKGGGKSTAAVVGDWCAIVSGGKEIGVSAYRLSLEKGEKLWSVPVNDNGASPVIHDGHVYAVAGPTSVCVALDSGQVRWQEKTDTNQVSSVVVADGKLYAVANRGMGLLAFRATPEKFEPLGTAKMNICICTSPTIAQGRLYVRQKYGLACYDLTRPAGQ